MTNQKVALITGITGQDGSYLAEFLLEKGYIVHGIKRRASSFNTQRVDHIYQDPHVDNSNFKLHYGDLSDTSNLIRIVQETQPDEIYNLGAQSHVAVSFESPEYTADVDGLGTLRLLEAIRILGLEKKTRFYQASTSELYGLVQETPQKETTPFYPRSPYAVAKMYAYWIVVNYREAYPADFIYDNLMVQANVIDAAFKYGVKKLLFLGSSCIYPRMAQQPMREDALLTGTLEPTNEPYAIAKIAGIKLCESYNRQFGVQEWN